MADMLMGSGLDKETVVKLESLINRMGGVLAAKVVTDGSGRPIEVHVLTNLERSPKQVARDVQSCAASACGVQLDYRIISVAQVSDDTLVSTSIRLKIKGFGVAMEDNSIIVRVSLANKGDVFEGTATGVSKSQGKYTTASLACVNSLHKFLGADYVFSVVDVQKTRIAGLDAFNVALNNVYDDRQAILTGVALVQDDEYLAVIKATLHAANRVLEKIWRCRQQGSKDIETDL
ncbi:MAG TPA: hypothetical protein PLI10_05930 [Bacillota bacterium]|nr:hypothetical protein [Bacillota bacterium]HOH10703.1 hypothetical protein [Bacillota bacterium]HOS50937.1 hypothetical protein [Bacillota bacterium]HOY89988.1 hypothetical protein [Bacillota bacterium]HPI01293.1 hypothetical protein [Bacillota bacterium]